VVISDQWRRIPRNTALELCRTLVTEGMLEGAGGGSQLGPLILELAGQITERTELLRVTA
jgi:DNA-binding IclR family transcriptional regulator